METMTQESEATLFKAAGQALAAVGMPIGHVPTKVMMIVTVMDGEGEENLAVMATTMTAWDRLALLEAEVLRAKVELSEKMGLGQ